MGSGGASGQAQATGQWVLEHLSILVLLEPRTMVHIQPPCRALLSWAVRQLSS